MLQEDHANGLSDLNCVSESPRRPAAYHISVNEELQHLRGTTILKIRHQYCLFVAKKRKCFFTFASTANRLREGKLSTTIMPPYCFLITSIFSLHPSPRHQLHCSLALMLPTFLALAHCHCSISLWGVTWSPWWCSGATQTDWGFLEQGVGLRSSQPPELF